LFKNNGEITRFFVKKPVLLPVKVSFFTQKRYLYRVCALIAACILKTLRVHPFSKCKVFKVKTLKTLQLNNSKTPKKRYIFSVFKLFSRH